MRYLRLIFSIIMAVAYTINAPGQDVGIGQWRDHLPWFNTIAVTEAGNIVYCASPFGIIKYFKEEDRFERMTKVTGLSDIGISDIRFSNQNQTLVIAYSNTNIDLVKDNLIINIPDIKRKQILGLKTINKVMIRNDYAYLSCGFGIVVVDIVKEEIHDTYYIGPNGDQIDVLDLTYNDTAFFAATEQGIYVAPVNSPNLANYEEWSRLQSIDPFMEYDLIESFSNRIFVNKPKAGPAAHDSILVWDGSSWTRFNTEAVEDVNNFQVCCNNLMISYAYYSLQFDEQLNEVLKIYTYGQASPRVADALLDSRGETYIADMSSGLVKVWGGGFDNKIIVPNGPSTTNIFSLSAGGDNVWIAPGGYTQTWSSLYFTGMTSAFSNGFWTNYSSWNAPVLDSIRDVVSIAIDPANPSRVFVGGFRNQVGAFEMINGEVSNVLDETNSGLQVWEAASSIAITGIDFDNSGNTWFTNSGAEKAVSVLRPGNEWDSYYLGSAGSNVDTRTLIATSGGQKWIVLRKKVPDQSNNLIVFNENNPAGNQVKILNGNAGNGSIPGSNVFSIAEDKEGEIWLGTDEGVVVFYNPSDLFTNSPSDAERILVNFDGYVQYLLETETVTAIAVDGANRKWMGTDRAGVFLLSADGTEQINHFTEDNSPLFSNQITALTINPETGEVYIGTAKGLIAYKGTATEGETEMDDIYAFPNPVPANYSGIIGIRGLVSNANVKITDLSGKLIYETTAAGGQATWDGKSFSGNKARSGVYMVFVTNEDGSSTMVTKIMIIE
jgi:hypothetical protein